MKRMILREGQLISRFIPGSEVGHQTVTRVRKMRLKAK